MTSLDSSWANLPELPFRWTAELKKKLAAERIPRLTGPTLYLASDTGGLHRGSRFEVLTVVVADVQGCQRWYAERMRVRQSYLADGRVMSYKALNDRNRVRALLPFLHAADGMTGLCISVAVDKNIDYLMCSAELEPKLVDEGVLQLKWKRRVLERMLRTTHLIGLILGGVSSPKQNVYWISDQDELFASPTHSSDTARMLSYFTTYYCRHELGELGVGTTAIDPGDRQEEDQAALADLVSGALAETLTTLAAAGGIGTRIVCFVPETSRKADCITSWFFEPKLQLKTTACIIRGRLEAMQVGTFRIA